MTTFALFAFLLLGVSQCLSPVAAVAVRTTRSPLAALHAPYDKGAAWITKDDQYIRIELAANGRDSLVGSPKNIRAHWKSIDKIGFDSVDAFIPLNDASIAWVFSGEEYGKIKIAGNGQDTYVHGPSSIVKGWKSLNQAGFNSVDATLIKHDDQNVAWVFLNDQYVTIRFDEQTDSVISGPHPIAGHWKSLTEVGFVNFIDWILVDPNNAEAAYFFSGENYVHINVVNDVVLGGGVRNVASAWPSLAQATFY